MNLYVATSHRDPVKISLTEGQAKDEGGECLGGHTFQTPYAAEKARKMPTDGENAGYTTSWAN